MTEKPSFGDALEGVFATLAKFSLPLYIDLEGVPALIGTGFFVKREGAILLVTAAHVFEGHDAANVYFYCTPSVKRRLSGTLTRNRHRGSRQTDSVDLAAVRLSGPSQPPYPEIEKYVIDAPWIEAQRAVSISARYGFVGFPASKSRVRQHPSEVRVSPYAFFGVSAPALAYAENGITGDSHICLRFDKKRSFGLDGSGRSFPKPHGVSGAPIFLIFDEEEAEPPPHFPLVGIATTWDPKRKLLIGTGATAIAELIEVAATDAGRHRPRS